MAPRKGCGPFTRVISADLSEEKNWYVLSHRICAMSPMRYFKKNLVVSAYPEEFAQVEMKSLRLVDGSIYRGKVCSEMEVVASSFGLLAVLLRQHPDKNALQEDGDLSGLKKYINGLDLSCIAIEGSVLSYLICVPLVMQKQRQSSMRSSKGFRSGKESREQ